MKPKHSLKEKSVSLDEFRKLLTQYKSVDFDGHTEFQRLNAEQRLTWLSQIAQFYFHTKKVQQPEV